MVGKAGLIVVVGFSIILGYMSLNLTGLAKRSNTIMSSYAEATQSHNLAITGVNIALTRFSIDTNWVGDTTLNLKGPQFFGKLRLSSSPVGDSVRIRSVAVYTSATYPLSETLEDTVEVLLARNSSMPFSLFAWMTNTENGVNWTTADTVWGRVHSNGSIHVNGAPVFYERVTTSENFVPRLRTGTNKGNYKRGTETGVPKVEFPKSFAELEYAAQNGGRHFKKPIWLELLPGSPHLNDGKVLVRDSPLPLALPIDTISLNGVSFNGALSSTDSIHIKGTLDGRLTVASLASNVYIDDNLKYEKSPLSSKTDDMLGLVARDNVIVDDNILNNADCIIEGSIFALNGSFTAEGHDRGPLFGELRLLGSIVQNARGPVGTIKGGKLDTGYSKRYRFDSRLGDPDERPPFYPRFRQRVPSVAHWWESFRLPRLDI
jgi:cytoskeletal protein CcmA (bactofilin family)